MVVHAAWVNVNAAAFVEDDFSTHLSQQLDGCGDIIEMWDIANLTRTIRQQAAGENRQHRILGAGSPNLTIQSHTTADLNSCH